MRIIIDEITYTIVSIEIIYKRDLSITISDTSNKKYTLFANYDYKNNTYQYELVKDDFVKKVEICSTVCECGAKLEKKNQFYFCSQCDTLYDDHFKKL